MGWYGIWNLEYTGNNKEKFVNTAKLVIANFRKRFELSEDGNELEAVKRLSWYSADKDIEKILSFLDDGDQIHVLIDGETHPYDDNDEELEWEEQTYKKENGQVSMHCEYTDADRYKSNTYIMKVAFIEELSDPQRARQEALKGGFTDTLDSYIEWIAQEMGDSEEMFPIIQNFMNEIMDINRDDVINKQGNIDEEAFTYFNNIKEKFKTLDTTKAYISEVKAKLPPKEEEKTIEIPELFANMNKRDVKQLGGMGILLELYEKHGEEKSRELLEILGYDLNGANKEKEIKQSSVGKKKAENEVNNKLKQSVIDYFLGCVKKKYPNLTQENAEIFSETLAESIDYKLEHEYFPTLSIDYDPCQELLQAFYSMDESNFDSGLPIHGVFPFKTHVRIERGKCATVSSEYDKTGILYMTDEHRQELLTSVNTRIFTEESKISQEVKDGFEQEYQTLIEALNIERVPLVKKEEETQKLLEQERGLQEKAQQLIDSYASRIDELENSELSEDEKKERKRSIIEEIKIAQKVARSDRMTEELGKIREKYGWQDLKDFDEIHKEDLDKQSWMKNRYIRYGREEYSKLWEQYQKEHPNEFGWPDTSGIPYELDRLYAQRDEIDEYDKKQEEKRKETNPEKQASDATSKEKQEFISALGRAYAEYMKEHGNIDKYRFKNQREQLLAEAFSAYFAKNYENLTNSAFLIDFENGVMRGIAEENGFPRITGWGFNLSTKTPHVKVTEGLVYSVDGMLDKVKIEYGTPEAIQSQIDRLNSRIRFMKDSEEKSWNISRFESQRDSFVEYQRQLQGEPEREPSLQELDQQKYILEGLNDKTQDLLEQYENSISRDEEDSYETEEVEFDD